MGGLPPPWNFSQLERVYIAGTSKDDFNWYRYKGDGTTVKTSLLNSVNSPVSSKKITIKVTDRLGKYFVKEYTTNNKGEISDIHARKKSIIEFFVGETSCKSRVAADGIPKRVILKDYECKFNTQTVPNKTIPTPSIETVHTQETQNNSRKDNEQNNSANNLLNEVTFNIKLVEGDTGKPIPNTTYHLEYKNNIKSHKTDGSGTDSGIKADVSQSISVYLDDDGGKKQSIYSMAFPVTGDLNGQTKVLKVPVVAFNIKFVNKNNQPIPHYEFKILYRGRQSAIKRANSQGISTVKALAGQKLTVIDGQGRAQTTAIVTYGSKQWTMMIGTNITEEDISNISDASSQEAPTTSDMSKQDATLKPETEQNPIIKVEKSEVKEVEKNTEEGPVLEVSNLAKITIKFVDEKTNKPLSGLSYITQSDLYGKNTSVTGKDGTRGRVHESKVGIEITVLAHEDGKEVKKGVITANTDKNGFAYVYKAKKSKIPNIEISFSDGTRSDVVTEKTKAILRELAQKYGMKEIVITSSLRTPEKQADAMYTNISKGKRIGYKGPGEQVTLVCEAGIRKGLPKETIIKNMVSKILEYERKDERVSLHCVSLDTYAKKNIVDLGINSNGLNTKSNQRKFQTICDKAKSEGKISRVLSPLTNSGEAAFHLEIPQ